MCLKQFDKINFILYEKINFIDEKVKRKYFSLM